jgi:hypothetical protein
MVKAQKAPNQMVPKKLLAFALGGLLALTATSARADDSELLDLLVKKRIVTKQEAEKLEAEASKQTVEAPQGTLANIRIGDWSRSLTCTATCVFASTIRITRNSFRLRRSRTSITIFRASLSGSGCGWMQISNWRATFLAGSS